MGQPQEFERSPEQQRTVDAKIARLRERIKTLPMARDPNALALSAILLGMLDLLGDEL
jgi:hypothetical protein